MLTVIQGKATTGRFRGSDSTGAIAGESDHRNDQLDGRRLWFAAVTS